MDQPGGCAAHNEKRARHHQSPSKRKTEEEREKMAGVDQQPYSSSCASCDERDEYDTSADQEHEARQHEKRRVTQLVQNRRRAMTIDQSKARNNIAAGDLR